MKEEVSYNEFRETVQRKVQCCNGEFIIRIVSGPTDVINRTVQCEADMELLQSPDGKMELKITEM